MSGNKTVEELGKDSGSFHFQYRCFYTEKTFFSIDFFLFRFVNSPSIALKMKFEKRGRERKLEIDGGRDIRDIRILVVIDALSQTRDSRAGPIFDPPDTPSLRSLAKTPTRASTPARELPSTLHRQVGHDKASRNGSHVPSRGAS